MKDSIFVDYRNFERSKLSKKNVRNRNIVLHQNCIVLYIKKLYPWESKCKYFTGEDFKRGW